MATTSPHGIYYPTNEAPKKTFEAHMQDTAESMQAALNATMPAGAILQYVGAEAPTGFLLCLGQAISRTTYAGLFAALGGESSPYGLGDGTTTFNVPNLQGRIPVGRDSTQSEFNTLGETGGAKTHTLTTAQMPSHTHIQDSHTHIQNSHNHAQDAHAHGFNVNIQHGDGTLVPNSESLTSGLQLGGRRRYADTTATNTATNQSTTATNQATTATNQNTGGGEAHNNLQPYIVLNYIVKT